MKTFEVNGHVRVKAWVDGVEFEDAAREQVMKVASLPFIFHHVAVMPDCHAGIGSTVGTVMATRNAIIPATVGVDIGCGMIAQKTVIKAHELPYSLARLRHSIERTVPHGRSHNGGPSDAGAHRRISDRTADVWNEHLGKGFLAITNKHPKLDHPGVCLQLGSLGTGNHFIEICVDETDNIWVMLHSGSRGVGNRIGSFFIELAKQDMRTWKINLPDEDLAYLPQGTQHFDEYFFAMQWAQEYATINRELMMQDVLEQLCIEVYGVDKRQMNIKTMDAAVNCHHNYCTIENHFGKNVFVTRKGAVSAREGQLGIIPANMGQASVIVRGKGNRDSFNSCSHGAGRRMSRVKAKKTFTLEDHIRATEGVECRKDADVIDETPGAYKDKDAVMKAQEDLVSIETTLKQLVCIKG